MGDTDVSPASFAWLVLTTALAVKLLVDLRLPFAPLRRWLRASAHVARVGEHPDEGPWQVRRADGSFVGEPHDRLAVAAALVPTADRVKSWAYELCTCPWCAGAWVAAAVLAAWVAFGPGTPVGLWWWPPVWLAAAVLSTAVKAMEGATE